MKLRRPLSTFASSLIVIVVVAVAAASVGPGAIVADAALAAPSHLPRRPRAHVSRVPPGVDRTRGTQADAAPQESVAATKTPKPTTTTSSAASLALAASLLLGVATAGGGLTATIEPADTAVPLQQQRQRTAPDLTNGAKVFESNCAACHVGGQNAIAVGRTLRKDVLEEYLGAPVDEERVRNFVKDGLLHRGAMLFGGRVTEEELGDVSSYVIDQALGEKW